MVIEMDRLPGLIQNSLSYTTDDDGYMTFLRFSEKQMAFYAENPFYRLMSTCSSGICLSFETDGNEVTLDCRTADMSREVLEQIKGEMTFGEILQKLGETVKKVNQARSRLVIIQHFDLYVDGHYLDAVRIGNDEIKFCITNPEHRRVHVRIWLPLYKPLSLRSVSSDATIWPHTSEQPRLLAFGDSITQGFVAGKPSFSFVTQLADLLEMDAINQPPHNPTCYSDGWFHPNITGFSYMAPRLYRIIKDWRTAGPA